MALKYKLILAHLFLFAFIISVSHCDENVPLVNGLNRSSFPSHFVFGAATSAYQIEGASNLRGKNIWDVFVSKHQDRISNHSDAFVAADSYHRYKEDVSLLSGLGFDAYRFSISWTRILPTGRISGGISARGVRYYSALIDDLISKGIQPFVTIFHFDLPQKLEEEYKGFLSQKIVEDYANYAELCFRLFGNKVKHWITLNEPWTYTTMGYAFGKFPPNRCSNREFGSPDTRCLYGNSGTEPYVVAHHLLLAHAAAVKIYREKYQKIQGGQIGISLVTQWFEPYDPNSQTDVDAANRSLDFMFGLYMDPLFRGAYPTEMVKYVDKERLPTFKPQEAAMVKGSYDFIGLNYYTAQYSQDIPCDKSQKNYLTDSCVSLTYTKDGKPIGLQSGAGWLYIYPKGFYKILVHIKEKYNNPLIYVTENGVCGHNEWDKPFDLQRVNYHQKHLTELRRAINDKKVKVKGYFVWSLMDNFEWLDGYFLNFGLIRVNYGNKSLKRSCKASARWFSNFLQKSGSPNAANVC
ncbi:beta-glucosidase 13-like [Coffea arabica]|uniref:Beta-glucosidase 13-like n=1 Tax=Coffea arabica TaxID=13443 RepID=A0ABM4WP82_COFAR